MATNTLTLNNGIEMPVIGFGVFETPAGDTASSVAEALRVGYRLVDTAAVYLNETGVGDGIRNADVAREDIFVETKLWISDYGYDAALHGFEKSAAKLDVEQIDLLLLHQPLVTHFELTLDAYRALEKLCADGKVRAIGVSNFAPDELSRLLAKAEVVPAVNQVEIHPYFQQAELQALHAEHGILTQAWSPMGDGPLDGDDRHSALENEVIGQIAEAHGRSPVQVVLRWHLQQGRSVVPEWGGPARIAENFDVFGFELSAEELSAIDAFDTGTRRGPEPADITLDNYGTPIPEA